MEKLGNFSKEEWTHYCEMLEHYFATNGVVEAERKRSIFLTVIGPSTYKLFRSLISPHKPGEKTLEELTAALKQHFDPTPSEIVQRYKFNSRDRQPTETIATFISELRSLAEFCNYRASLDEMLRDRLVCGINNNIIRRRLFAESKLTLPKALEIALGMETAAKNADT